MRKCGWVVLMLVLVAVCGVAAGDVVGGWNNGLGCTVWRDTESGETVWALAPVRQLIDFTTGSDLGAGAILTDGGLLIADADNSGTVALTSGADGIARLTSGAADDDAVELATLLAYTGSRNVVAEFRLAVNDVAHTGVCFGVSDATSEASDVLAYTFNTAGLSVSTASDGAYFVVDADKPTTTMYGCAVKANVDATPVSTGVTVANGVFHVYRLEVDADGDVEWFVDGVSKGGAPAAVTATTALCGYVGIINREAAANTCDVDYIRIWQKR